MAQLPDFPYKLPNAQWKKNALVSCVHWDSICYFIKSARIFYWEICALVKACFQKNWVNSLSSEVYNNKLLFWYSLWYPTYYKKTLLQNNVGSFVFSEVP